MLDLSTEEWRQVRDESGQFEDSFMWEVVCAELQYRCNSLLNDLDNPKNEINVINFAQGGRFHLKRAIMVVRDLRRQAHTHLNPKKRSHEDDNA